MATTDVQRRKLELIQWLAVMEDMSLLDKISELKEQSTHDWWENISGPERESISRGLEDAEAGKLNPQSEARAIYGKRV